MNESTETSRLVRLNPSLPAQRETANLTKRGLADLQLVGSADMFFKQAMMYRRRKQYEKCFLSLQRALLTDPQHLDAMTWIGVSYNDGRGVERDEEMALPYFRQAAERGHAHAQLCLGLTYAKGEGVEKNLTQAVTWFRKAAQQGDAGAGNENA